MINLPAMPDWPLEDHKILVVDDDLSIRTVVTRVLEREGWRVKAATNAFEALDHLQQDVPSLVVCDIMMPKMSGTELVRKIRADERMSRAYVLMLTAKGDLDDMVDGLDAGADDYMSKPFKREELQARVRSGLRLVESRNRLLEAQRRLLGQSQMAMLGSLAAGVAHQFRNLFTGVGGYSELALMQQDDAAVQRALEVAVESSHRGNAICRNLLSFVSGDDERSSMELDPVDVVEMVVPLMTRDLKMRGAEVRVESEPGASVIAAPGPLQQALLNLLANARDAVTEGDVITVRVGPDGDDCVIAVEDTGTGIDEENIGRVFDPFFTTKAPAEPGQVLAGAEAAGVGLGLTITWSVVHSLGGEVKVDSERGRGTTVSMRIPGNHNQRTGGNGTARRADAPAAPTAADEA